jgi:hypothetical protein
MRSATTALHGGLPHDEASWIQVLARVGFVAKGLSYGLVGLLALELAVGQGGKATSRQGALTSLARHPFGKVVLVLLALGFASYALWRFADAGFGRTGEDGAKDLAKRAGYAGRGLVYAGLTFSACKIVAGSGGGGSQDAKAHRATAQVLSWPGGTWIVGIAGALLIGVGLHNGYRGVERKFLKRWRDNLGESARRWGSRAGVVGLLARAVVFVLIGVFAIRAARDYDPKESIGLDGALQKLAHESYGSWLLGLVAAGFVAYAIFCLAEARYREV